MTEIEKVDLGREYAKNFLEDELSEDLMHELDVIGNCVNWEKKEYPFGLAAADLYYNFCRLDIWHGDYLLEKNNLSLYDMPYHIGLIRYMMSHNLEDPDKVPLTISQEFHDSLRELMPGEKPCLVPYLTV